MEIRNQSIIYVSVNFYYIYRRLQKLAKHKTYYGYIWARWLFWDIKLYPALVLLKWAVKWHRLDNFFYVVTDQDRPIAFSGIQFMLPVRNGNVFGLSAGPHHKGHYKSDENDACFCSFYFLFFIFQVFWGFLTLQYEHKMT